MALPTWQIAGGPSDRSYVDVFFKYGVGLIGPGDTGPWTPERDADPEFDPAVKQFARDPKTGEVFLLRVGQRTVTAIGTVASEYVYLDQFDEVNGWDLQHGRRVRWFQFPKPQEFEKLVFGANPPRFSRCYKAEVIDFAEKAFSSVPSSWASERLPDLPPLEPTLDPIPSELGALLAEIGDLLPMYWNRDTFDTLPSEDETLTHFVVPFFRALGWPPELIAVKWRSIDVAIFDRLPRIPENCHFVVEAKRLGSGVEGALEQAKGYVAALGVPRDIIVTDGVRYRLYSCARAYAPVAYANLSRLKKSAIELFERLRRA